MLKPAQLYKEKLYQAEVSSWYDPQNIFYHGWFGCGATSLPEDTYNRHCFVSVNKNDDVVGYISYNVDYAAMSADNFCMISYKKGSIQFAKDVFKVICNLFEIYNMNRISWDCFVGNPAIRGYRNFIKKYGGRECAYYRKTTKLQDGKLYDKISFEILYEEFMGNKK